MLLLSNLLTKFIQTGTLRVFDSRGRLHSFGDKAARSDRYLAAT